MKRLFGKEPHRDQAAVRPDDRIPPDGFYIRPEKRTDQQRQAISEYERRRAEAARTDLLQAERQRREALVARRERRRLLIGGVLAMVGAVAFAGMLSMPDPGAANGLRTESTTRPSPPTQATQATVRPPDLSPQAVMVEQTGLLLPDVMAVTRIVTHEAIYFRHMSMASDDPFWIELDEPVAVIVKDRENRTGENLEPGEAIADGLESGTSLYAIQGYPDHRYLAVADPNGNWQVWVAADMVLNETVRAIPPQRRDWGKPELYQTLAGKTLAELDLVPDSVSSIVVRDAYRNWVCQIDAPEAIDQIRSLLDGSRFMDQKQFEATTRNDSEQAVTVYSEPFFRDDFARWLELRQPSGPPVFFAISWQYIMTGRSEIPAKLTDERSPAIELLRSTAGLPTASVNAFGNGMAVQLSSPRLYGGTVNAETSQPLIAFSDPADHYRLYVGAADGSPVRPTILIDEGPVVDLQTDMEAIWFRDNQNRIRRQEIPDDWSQLMVFDRNSRVDFDWVAGETGSVFPVQSAEEDALSTDAPEGAAVSTDSRPTDGGMTTATESWPDIRGTPTARSRWPMTNLSGYQEAAIYDRGPFIRFRLFGDTPLAQRPDHSLWLGTEKISDNVVDFAVDSGGVVYQNAEGLYRADIPLTSQTIRSIAGPDVVAFCPAGPAVFFATRSGLYRYSLWDGQTDQISDHTLYQLSSTGNGAVYGIDRDGLWRVSAFGTAVLVVPGRVYPYALRDGYQQAAMVVRYDAQGPLLMDYLEGGTRFAALTPIYWETWRTPFLKVVRHLETVNNRVRYTWTFPRWNIWIRPEQRLNPSPSPLPNPRKAPSGTDY